MAHSSKEIALPEKNNPHIFLISLGCPRNLVDSEVLLGAFKNKGFRIVGSFRKHSVAIVNTCAFIEDAKKESIDQILRLAELKKKGELRALIIAGCLSQRYSKNLMEEIPEIDAVFGAGDFISIPGYVERILRGKHIVKVKSAPQFLYNDTHSRSVITGSHSVYVKIQEGCMNFCSYCVIPKIRGPFRSRSMESVEREIEVLKKSGAKEINLIGQDTTLYGMDRYKKRRLSSLLKKASSIMRSGWIRLLYTHPAHYDKELIEVIAGEPSICKYLDLPIQHISDRILKRMNRKVTRKNVTSLITELRNKVPGLGIRTSLIVGFPGERESDFNELLEYVKSAKFDRLGVFLYSREEGTKAHDFPGQVPEEEKSRRFNAIMEAQKKVSMEINNRYMGTLRRVLIDEKDRNESGRYIGRTEHDAPEVDGVVYIKSAKALKKGDFVDVKIHDTLEYDLVGTHEPSK